MTSRLEKRGRGRPRQGSGLKQAPLSVRTSVELRQRVETSARLHGRSIAQEVEARLLLTFDWENDQHMKRVARAALGSRSTEIMPGGNDNGDGH